MSGGSHVTKYGDSLTFSKANCWFFCSVIHEHLQARFGGVFEHGDLKHTDLARNIRRRIEQRLRGPSVGPDLMPQPSTSRQSDPSVVSARQPRSDRNAVRLSSTPPNNVSPISATYGNTDRAGTASVRDMPQDEQLSFAAFPVGHAPSLSVRVVHAQESNTELLCTRISMLRRIRRFFWRRK